MKVYRSFEELIGGTPLLKLENYTRKNGLGADIYAKLEYFNPAGSVKDRVARAMIDNAEKSGKLKKGGTIIEPTSGNTGIGLSACAVPRGYRVILTMPETMSAERIALMKAYGAEVVLTDGAKGMRGAIERAQELCASVKDGMLAGQFTNSANPQAHFNTTGPEIWRDMDGKADVFVAGVGTGGTITGAGKFLKLKNPDIRIVAVEPEDSPVLTKGCAGPHRIQGIGAGYVPEILDTSVYDEVYTAGYEKSCEAVRNLAVTEGILVGVSSGAVLCASAQIAKREEFRGKNIVAVFPDGGDRYLSAHIFG